MKKQWNKNSFGVIEKRYMIFIHDLIAHLRISLFLHNNLNYHSYE
jgi:hypothetical protein